MKLTKLKNEVIDIRFSDGEGGFYFQETKVYARIELEKINLYIAKGLVNSKREFAPMILRYVASCPATGHRVPNISGNSIKEVFEKVKSIPDLESKIIKARQKILA